MADTAVSAVAAVANGAQSVVQSLLEKYKAQRGCIIKVQNRLPNHTLGGTKDLHSQNHPTYFIDHGNAEEPVDPGVVQVMTSSSGNQCSAGCNYSQRATPLPASGGLADAARPIVVKTG